MAVLASYLRQNKASERVIVTVHCLSLYPLELEHDELKVFIQPSIDLACAISKGYSSFRSNISGELLGLVSKLNFKKPSLSHGYMLRNGTKVHILSAFCILVFQAQVDPKMSSEDFEELVKSAVAFYVSILLNTMKVKTKEAEYRHALEVMFNDLIIMARFPEYRLADHVLSYLYKKTVMT
jgi:hypothetical protein